MEICSIWYLLACCGIVIVFHLLPRPSTRRLFLGVVNSLFLLPFLRTPQICVWFALFVLGTFAALVLVRARPRGAVVWSTIAVVVAGFAYVRKYTFIPYIVPVELWWDAWGEPMAVVGLSYMLFKFIHMLVDEWQGQLASFHFFSYLNYQLAFFTLIAGPIQRYNDFQRGWDEMDCQPVELRQSWSAWNRILTGMIKMRMIAPLVERLSSQAATDLAGPNHVWALLIAFYAFPVQLYFNFSGYTDTAIGSAQLLGFRLPENFNRPYLARNVLDFWNRWHMSLTTWIRDYVFMASYKAAATSYPRWSKGWAYLLLFVALFITGIWHGTTAGFVVFGVLNGIGAAANRAYGDALRAGLGRAGLERYVRNPLIECVAILVTFHYVCFCHLAFASAMPRPRGVVTEMLWRVREIASALSGRPAIVAGVAALAISSLLTAALWQGDVLNTGMARLKAWMMQRPHGLSAVLLLQTLVIAYCLLVDLTARQQAPPVIYMRF